ncbi:MAG TPA: hypothetical protein ENH82_13875 [bacterium]|nr:hypothetical protein [bacterium]
MGINTRGLGTALASGFMTEFERRREEKKKREDRARAQNAISDMYERLGYPAPPGYLDPSLISTEIRTLEARDKRTQESQLTQGNTKQALLRRYPQQADYINSIPANEWLTTDSKKQIANYLSGEKKLRLGGERDVAEEETYQSRLGAQTQKEKDIIDYRIETKPPQTFTPTGVTENTIQDRLLRKFFPFIPESVKEEYKNTGRPNIYDPNVVYYLIPPPQQAQWDAEQNQIGQSFIQEGGGALYGGEINIPDNLPEGAVYAGTHKITGKKLWRLPDGSLIELE